MLSALIRAFFRLSAWRLYGIMYHNNTEKGSPDLKILKHIVMWRFLDEAQGRTREENMRFVAERLRALVGVAPTLLSLEVGDDVLHSPQSGDMALICEFNSLEDMHAYRDFPPHAEISAYIKLVTSERRVADFYVEVD